MSTTLSAVIARAQRITAGLTWALLTDVLKELKDKVKDVGTYVPIDLSTTPPKNVVDFPDYGVLVGREVAEGGADLGVCVCGSGIGIGIAANKVAGVRAATCNGDVAPQMAEATRKHNDANVICFGKSSITPEVASEALRKFLATKFEANYHTGRVE